MLPELVPAPDFLALTYRPDLDVLISRWLRQPTAEELHAGYHALLDAAAARHCRYWLLDVRGRATSNAEHTQWMIEHFFPLLPARLGGQACLAYLFAPKHLHELEADRRVPPLTFFDDKPYCAQRFTDEAAAVEWLRAQRVSVAARPAAANG